MRTHWLLTAMVLMVTVTGALGQGAPEPSGGPRATSTFAGAPVTAAPGGMAVQAGSRGGFYGSVPTGKATQEALPLSLDEAMQRALRNNLGLQLSAEDRRASEAVRLKALSEVLPHLSARTQESVQQVNLAAFGFSGFPGIPQIIGPFGLFDARAYLSQSVLDMNSFYSLRSASQGQRATEAAFQDARQITLFIVANLYLQANAGASRIEATQAEVDTAQAVYNQAVDFKKSGLVPAIQVLRAQVELQGLQQRLIYYQNEFEKQKLDLVRAIGLPAGQSIRLTDIVPYAQVPPMSMDDALSRALNSRADYRSLALLVSAAETARKAASAERLPTVSVQADYGAIGERLNESHGTFTLAGNLRIPIFEGGKVRADVLRADALLRQRRAEQADMAGRIEYELRASLLDLKASEDRVKVAESARQLAGEQLGQAKDRFKAGVTDNIEVVQAQEALANANENYISSLYAYNVAKAALARAMGVSENNFRDFLLGGKQ